jgi:copper chaperone CopZ
MWLGLVSHENAGRSWRWRVTSTGRHGRLVNLGYVFCAMVSVLTISGMLAVHAKRAVFTALAGVPGVVSAEVEMGRVVVVHEPTTSAAALSEAIAAIGCDVTSVRTERRLPLTD